MTQQDAYRLIQRHAKHAGIRTPIGNHSMRATGITDYLKSDGSPSLMSTTCTEKGSAGRAPGYVGLYQVNAQVPAGLAVTNRRFQ
jgi:hypothetical protein